jgi:hypothetical protein
VVAGHDFPHCGQAMATVSVGFSPMPSRIIADRPNLRSQLASQPGEIVPLEWVDIRQIFPGILAMRTGGYAGPRATA